MSAATITVPVNLPGREYAVEIGAGLLGEVGSRMATFLPARRATILTDDVVGPLYAGRVSASLDAAGIAHAVVTIPAGDAYKTLDTAAELYDALAELRHERGQPILALGGGMVGDLAGFVAATWLRGVPLVHCPTTLEAAIDAGVGGKTAVNHARGKNLIGAFHQPRAVWTDIDTFATLGDRDYRAALAESVKHAAVADAMFLDWQRHHATRILSREAAVVMELIARNCRIKAAVVVADERETSCETPGRAALNFGHTVGHAIEAASDYVLRHGEAVALGILAETRLATTHAALSRSDAEAIRQLLNAFGLASPPVRVDARRILERLPYDKKVSGGQVRFVVPARIGAARWLDHVALTEIGDAIKAVL